MATEDAVGLAPLEPLEPLDPNMPRRRVAVFGGSFNPPHVGHVLAVVYALATAPIDEVLVVPVYRHPFAKHLAPFEERLAMLDAAVGWIPRVKVSRVEEELGGESRTLRTIEHLVATEPSWSLRLLVGADVLGDLPKWHRWDRIAELAEPLVLERAGVAPSAVALLGGDPAGAVAWVGEGHGRPVLPRVSSTEIREALAAGRVDAVRALVPARVLERIAARRLYGAGSNAARQPEAGPRAHENAARPPEAGPRAHEKKEGG